MLTVILDGCFDNSGGERFPFNTARALRDVTQSASVILLAAKTTASCSTHAANQRRRSNWARWRAVCSIVRCSRCATRPATLSTISAAKVLRQLRLRAAWTLPAAGAGRTGDGGCGEIVAADTLQLGAATTWLNDGNTGNWRFADGNLSIRWRCASRRRHGVFARRRAHPANRSACACGADCFDRNGRGDRRLAGAGVDRSGSG